MQRTARELAELLSTIQSPRKRLGQHFLTDERILTMIAKHASLGDGVKERHILEIGPGAGGLTKVLLNKGHRVISMEIDPLVCEHIRRIFPSELGDGSLELIEGDALHEPWPESLTDIVANIPYQISSPLIDKLDGSGIVRCVLMVQDEFARRLAGKDGPASRGPLWISTALNWDVILQDKVPPTAFIPQPQINSRIVVMHSRNLLTDQTIVNELGKYGLPVAPARTLKAIAASSFQQRRKKIRNSLSRLPAKLRGRNGWNDGVWEVALRVAFSTEYSSFGNHRPESLELQDWLLLAASIENSR